MSEQKVPVLTLKPEEETMQEAVAQAVAQLEAPAAPNADNAVAAALDENFTEEEKAEIARFAGTIDVTNPDHVMLYGADAQKKVSAFSDTILANIKNSESGEVGDILTDLIAQLEGFEGVAQKPKGLRALFYSAKSHMAAIQARYDVVSANVETIAESLEKHQVQLLKDVAMFNRLYEMYISAGEMRLKEVREGDLVKLREKAAATGDAMDAQAAKDLSDMCDRFEKKLHDLKLSRQVSLQMAPQIRMLQNNNALLNERIQSTLVNTLPLWKNQMVLSVGLHHSQQAMKAQRAVTNATNELLAKNAEMLKMGTIETAKEAERGIIDLETLTKTNQDLIDTIAEVQRIQSEAREQRRQAEVKLNEMEAELKRKMLEG